MTAKIRERKLENNGVSYRHHELLKPVEATVTYDDKRLVFRGVFTVTDMSGSWKYGNQIQFTLWTNQIPAQEARAKNNGWCEVAINLTEADALEILNHFLKRKMEASKCS